MRLSRGREKLVQFYEFNSIDIQKERIDEQCVLIRFVFYGNFIMYTFLYTN